MNSYLGFDQYHFIENFYQAFPEDDIPWDYTFFPQLTADLLKQVQEDTPVFSFSVSYQGHGPYGDYECWWGEMEDYIANYAGRSIPIYPVQLPGFGEKHPELPIRHGGATARVG